MSAILWKPLIVSIILFTYWSTSSLTVGPELHFIHTLAFLAMHESSRAKGEQLQGTPSQVCPECFLPFFVNSTHTLLNMEWGLQCQGWKDDELPY